MAGVRFETRSRCTPTGRGPSRSRPDGRTGRAADAPRAIGLRQDDGASQLAGLEEVTDGELVIHIDGRITDAEAGMSAGRGLTRLRELCALAGHDRRRERRVRPRVQEHAESAEVRAASPRSPAASGFEKRYRPPRHAVRRTAAARCARAMPSCSSGRRSSARRTALEPRRAASDHMRAELKRLHHDAA